MEKSDNFEEVDVLKSKKQVKSAKNAKYVCQIFSSLAQKTPYFCLTTLGWEGGGGGFKILPLTSPSCLLYTSDAADE